MYLQCCATEIFLLWHKLDCVADLKGGTQLLSEEVGYISMSRHYLPKLLVMRDRALLKKE